MGISDPWFSVRLRVCGLEDFNYELDMNVKRLVVLLFGLSLFQLQTISGMYHERLQNLLEGKNKKSG
jgi:hypothetical protein